MNANSITVGIRTATRTWSAILALILATLVMGLHPSIARASCSSPANAIEAENCLPGTNSSVWTVDGSGDPTIQGFATAMSVNAGQTISFKINTTARAYTIQIFRLGYYAGNGARNVANINPSATLPQSQPACRTDPTTDLYDCGTWAVSASWAVPSTAVSGLYLALLTRTDTGGQSQIWFVVRNDAVNSDIVFQTSDETWQAYNPYGGNSLYGPNGTFDLTNRAYKVSYNRPLTTLDLEDESFPLYAEYPMIRWLEANAYSVTYLSSVDAATSGSLLLNHKIYLSVGHDEYVSGPKRTNVQAARDAGVSLAFFSGNEFFWKTRWENSIDGSSTPNRTLVCYKETLGPNSNPVATAAVDPDDPPTWTGTWRDPTKSPPADGGKPENALTGQLFRVNGPAPDNTDLSIEVPAAQGKLRFWRNTQVAAQTSGQTWTLPAGTLGYEWDDEEDNGSRPAGLFDMSTATYTLTTDYLQDYGGLYGAGVATHHISLYRAPSGALVFGAGTVQWSWGLDSNHTGEAVDSDVNMQQATVNLFADMGVQPATLQSGLVRATASTDHTPPTSIVTAPMGGATVHVAMPVTITGTASDTGGLVAGVEVSYDDGNTWHPATGTTSWTYTWIPVTTGTATLESRAVDDSANLETPTRTVNVTVAGPICPCSLFVAQQPVNVDLTDSAAYELGMKFQATSPGQITAIRYWRAANETGSHTGRIWSATGTQLASATFSSETASGWQTATLSTPLQILANTTYVVSVNVNAYYVATDGGLASSVVNGTLSSVADGANGVFGNPGVFPSNSYESSNYFRDVAFTPTSQAVKLSGDNQVGVPGTTLPTPLVAEVLDPNGNPISGATVSFSVTAGGGSVSPASAVTGANGQASARLTLGAVGVNTVQATAAGVGSVSFRAVAQQDTVFTTQTPVAANATDKVAYELGTKLQVSEPGQINAIRYWKAASETGTHVGNIWSATGALLASVSFSGETTSGWQIQALTSPLAVQANTTYVVSVNTNLYYVATNSGLASTVANGYLSTVADGANGVFGNPGAFPTNSYQSTNYFRDVSFTNTPSIIKTSGDAQTGAAGTTLPAPLVVEVRDANANPISGTIVSFSVTAGGGSVSAASAVTNASGQASVTLTLGSTGGTDTVQATATGFGSVSFNAVALQDTLFTTQTPAIPNATDNVAYELGMKFQTSTAGQISAIIYWKAPSETGTHTGKIWSATGTLLASVTFSGETASGWQTQALTSPLQIQANTTYVVSVNANVYYVATGGGLANAVVNGDLSSVVGANGVYGSAGVFPSNSYNNTNYFRDVSFVP